LEYANLGDRFVDEISKCVVGRKEIIRLMLVSLLSQGHILLEGDPGLGKTTLARAFAQTIGGDFKRIQMTPDTLPADILGTFVFNQQSGAFELHAGPIFGNIILVDELNRATPKAQSALLESMQERQVSFEGKTRALNEPFMVIATQVRFGSAGTYPLSDVQSDRFAFSILLDFPPAQEELEILSRIDEIQSQSCAAITSLKEISSISETIKEVFVSNSIKEYIVALSNYLRTSDLLKIRPSPRASISLHKGARSLAFLDGRDHVIPDDVKFLAQYVFGHRVVLTPEAIDQELSTSKIVSQMLDQVAVPREYNR